MICKNCQKEMPEAGDFCPFCGTAKETVEETVAQEIVAEEVICEELIEETAEAIDEADDACEETELTEEELLEAENEEEPQQPKKKLKLWQLIAIIAGGVMLLAILAGAVLYGMYTMGIDLKPRANDLYFKDSYTAEDAAIEKASDTVVATLGDKELTIAQLQLYYTNDIYSFMSQYGSYLGHIGLDVSMPLEDQAYPMGAEGQTWQQYFLQTALTSWQSYALVDMLVAEDGYTLPEELQAQMDGMAAEIDAIATSYGYATAQEYLDEMMTPGITLEEYMEFNRSYYTASAYLDDCFVKFTPTADEVQAYYEENLETFNNNGIMPDIGLQSTVRHILIQPEGTTDENNNVTYSDEAKAVAYEEAERILEEWKSGEATEESFAELANTYSQDGGSNTTGGLYEGVNVDASFVEEFKAWAADATRKEGDTEIVETQFGYHIMYFVSGEDYFTYQVSQQLITQRVQQMLLDAQLKYPMEVNYKKILLYTPAFG